MGIGVQYFVFAQPIAAPVACGSPKGPSHPAMTLPPATSTKGQYLQGLQRQTTSWRVCAQCMTSLNGVSLPCAPRFQRKKPLLPPSPPPPVLSFDRNACNILSVVSLVHSRQNGVSCDRCLKAMPFREAWGHPAHSAKTTNGAGEWDNARRSTIVVLDCVGGLLLCVAGFCALMSAHRNSPSLSLSAVVAPSHTSRSVSPQARGGPHMRRMSTHVEGADRVRLDGVPPKPITRSHAVLVPK